MKRKSLYCLLLSILLIMCSCTNNKQTHEVIKTYIVNGKEVSEEEYNAIMNTIEEETTEEINESISKEESIQAELQKIVQRVDESMAEKKAYEEKNKRLYPSDKHYISNGDVELELTLNYTSIQEEIHNTSDNRYGMYYPDQEDESYFLISFTIKNLGGDTISSSIFDSYMDKNREDKGVTLIVNDKYNYDLLGVDSSSDILTKFWAIEPLKSKEIYFFTSLPNELLFNTDYYSDINCPYRVELSIVNDDHTYTYYNN